MELVKAYGINIKYNNTSGFERLVTFDSYSLRSVSDDSLLTRSKTSHCRIGRNHSA